MGFYIYENNFQEEHIDPLLYGNGLMYLFGLTFFRSHVHLHIHPFTDTCKMDMIHACFQNNLFFSVVCSFANLLHTVMHYS